MNLETTELILVVGVCGLVVNLCRLILSCRRQNRYPRIEKLLAEHANQSYV